MDGKKTAVNVKNVALAPEKADPKELDHAEPIPSGGVIWPRPFTGRLATEALEGCKSPPPNWGGL